MVVKALEKQAERLRKRQEELQKEIELRKTIEKESEDIKKMSEELHPSMRTKLKGFLGTIKELHEELKKRREKELYGTVM